MPRRTMLTDDQVRAIRVQALLGETQKDIATRFNVSPAYIGAIVRNERRMDVPSTPPNRTVIFDRTKAALDEGERYEHRLRMRARIEAIMHSELAEVLNAYARNEGTQDHYVRMITPWVWAVAGRIERDALIHYALGSSELDPDVRSMMNAEADGFEVLIIDDENIKELEQDISPLSN
jgi:hypothetical protein